MPLETAPALPWKCPSNQLFPTQEFPFAPEESPSCRSSTSSQLLLATLQQHRAFIGSHQWRKCHCAVSILHNTAPFNTQTAMRQRAGTLLWSVLYSCRTYRPTSSTKPLLSLSHTFALDAVLLNFSTANHKVKHCIYRAFFPHLCWTVSIVILFFVIVFALVMLNKPEASTTANTKIDFVHKRIKELTHVEVLSPFTENRHFFMTAQLLWRTEI